MNLVSDDDEIHQGTMYLTFSVGTESYGLDIRTVTEIIGLQRITRVPDVPEYMRGVINLRGRVIPVVDVRARLRLAAQEYHDRTCIIVIEVHGAHVGLVVDSVSEVLTIGEQDVEPVPAGFGHENGFVSGLGKVGQDVKLILNAATLVDVGCNAGANQSVAAAS